MRSPPKRLTRARAAKEPEPMATSKSTKIVTAAAKARATVSSSLTASTKSTAAKRKTRTDDADEEERQASLAKRPRGRPPKKAAEEEKGAAMAVVAATASTGPEAARATRTRVTAQKGAAEIAKEESTAPKPVRGRPKKVESKVEGSDNQPEQVKKATRGRPPTVMKSASTTTTVANKPPVKKTVKFREPDKENVEPAAIPKEPATAGMRGRPARRGGAAAARTTTRPATKPSKPQAGAKKPLSPKKITQLTLSQYESEDELALEKVSAKPLAKGPIKPPSKKAEIIEIEPETTTVAVNAAMFDIPEVNTAMFASPARRHVSPPRDTLKSPAKRIAVPLPGSALKLSNDSVGQTPFKTSMLLQSAAKRPQSPIKPFIFSAQKEPASESTAKLSMLQSPAKRAFPGFRSLSDTRQPDLPTLDESPVATPTRAAKSSQKLMIEEDLHEDVEDDPFAGPIGNPQFSKNPSTELAHHADSAVTEVEAEEEAAEEAEVEEEVEGVEGAEEEVETEAEPEKEPENREEEEEEEEGEEEALQNTEIQETQTPDEEADDAAEESIIVATEEQEGEDSDAPVDDGDENGDEDEDEDEDGDEDEGDSEDTMLLDDLVTEAEEATHSSPKAETPAQNPLYQLRQKDLDPCHDLSSASDSEDDTLPFERITTTPSIEGEKTPRTRASRSPRKQSRRSTLGFTSLSDQLGSWSAASPVKSALSFVVAAQSSDTEDDESFEDEAEPSNRDTPMKNAFFGSNRLIHSDAVTPAVGESTVENDVQQSLDEEAMIMDEDLALAQEANEMSLMDPKENEDSSNTRHSFDDSLSDASQEYGDENQVPVDRPAPSAEPQAAPVTPVGRPMTRSFNTTTKVPLKPADDSTPSPLKKKSFSASRAAPKRPGQPRRGAPVLSYSPEKQQRRRSLRNFSTISEESEEPAQSAEPSTPAAKMDLWSSIGTPARTPRKDLNPNLLRGAIVFVDVHTSEGADASGIFIELLTQMGARCPQKWNWNPSSANNSESTKVGITHVVFKDGSKRTLEKVREANGVVQCVGVSWVLDCERENKWLDESPYHIDTSSVPRGGARRRKSMEPKAIANINGSVGNSSSKERRESAPASPSTPNRRQSSIWIHTPSDLGEEQGEKEEEDIEWSNLVLTPVPKTPAPETIMKFATETPSNADEDDDDEDEDEEDATLTREELLTRTCPPKAQKFVQLGGGILSKDTDEHVLLRLMAARRKSLQFAPKVGSPLAKMWQ